MINTGLRFPICCYPSSCLSSCAQWLCRERKSRLLHMVAVPRRGKTTISRLGTSPAHQCRKLSRTTRLILLRPGDRLSTWRETAIPRRGCASAFTRASTLKQPSAETSGSLKTCLNSVGLVRRCLRLKSARDIFNLPYAVGYVWL